MSHLRNELVVLWPNDVPQSHRWRYIVRQNLDIYCLRKICQVSKTVTQSGVNSA
jgi:hypothetical protein